MVSRRSEREVRRWPDDVRLERVGPHGLHAEPAILPRALLLWSLGELGEFGEAQPVLEESVRIAYRKLVGFSHSGILGLQRFSRREMSSDLPRVRRTMLHLASRKNSSSNRFDLCFFHGRKLSSAMVVLSKQIVNRRKLPQVRRILTSGLTNGHPGAYGARTRNLRRYRAAL